MNPSRKHKSASFKSADGATSPSAASAPTMTFSLSLKVLLIDENGRCLLLRRSASSKNHGGKWELPGGKVDEGENFDTALQREVFEETGLSLRLVRPFETACSRLPDRQVVYLVMLADADPGEVRLSSEHDAAKWVEPGKLEEELDICPQFRRVVRHYAQYVRSQKPGRKEEPLPMVQPGDLDKHLADFMTLRPRLETFKEFLKTILTEKIKPLFPLASIGGRAKGVVSFADKIIKKNKYKKPLKDMTDLVGLRIIVHLPSEVKAVGQIIRDTFHIDEVNSLDMLDRLGPDKFGYRSVHYIVEIIRNRPAGVEIPPELIGLKAEVQVRTIAQHAWSDIGHDRLYKGACEVSDYWKREASRVAALLEAADEEFQRLVEGVAFYEAHRPRCPSCDHTRCMIELVRTIRKYDPENLELVLRHARLAAEIEDWAEILRALKKVDVAKRPILMALQGLALWMRARNDLQRQAARRRMEQAAEIEPRSAEPYLILGDCLSRHGRNLDALKCYRLAFELEPGNPAALSGYIRHKALANKDPEFVSVARPAIRTAIERCRELAAARADLPRSLYRIGGFLQLLGPEEEVESLATFARAVRETTTSEELCRSLSNMTLMAECEPQRQDIECARRFLAAALCARFPEAAMPDGCSFPNAKPIANGKPIVIVAGGCDPYIEISMQSYRELLHAAFADFEGVIISGGTKQGVSGLVGEIAARSKGRIRAIGYLPPQLPLDHTASRDRRYTEIRKTDSKRFFSPTEAVQVWLDLLKSGVKPETVRLLGINGGLIAGLEYRFALALGAKVGLLQKSGREADRLLKEWSKDDPNLMVLPRDPMALRAFFYLGVKGPGVLEDGDIEKAAQQVHEEFLDQQRYKHSDPVMQPWAQLREDLINSNRNQITYLENILNANGFGIRDAVYPFNNPRFTKKEIERMAEMEHGRWVVERVASGWRYGPKKDAEKKISPHLVDWKILMDDVRKYDRDNVRLWPELLAKVGKEIYRVGDKQSSTPGNAVAKAVLIPKPAGRESTSKQTSAKRTRAKGK